MTTTMDGETQVPGSAPAERLRVLLVDDNASVLRFLASAFSSNGCQVTTAATAEQALEQLSDDPYDLVVSDIKMPGLSGLDLLRAVKGKQPGTPVVLITGVPSVNSAVFGLRHGAYDYLPKPFSVTEVKELIRRLRRDRADGNGNVNYPAGLTEELARRQGGVEAISRIGEVALQGLEPSVFAEKVVEYTMQSLRCDGALMLLRDQGGSSTRATRASRRWSARSWRSCKPRSATWSRPPAARRSYSPSASTASRRWPRWSRAWRCDGYSLHRPRGRPWRLPARREGAPARVCADHGGRAPEAAAAREPRKELIDTISSSSSRSSRRIRTSRPLSARIPVLGSSRRSWVSRRRMWS